MKPCTKELLLLLLLLLLLPGVTHSMPQIKSLASKSAASALQRGQLLRPSRT
jgi:hypothetical protein